jgi:hypothetical protein
MPDQALGIAAYFVVAAVMAAIGSRGARGLLRG